MLSCCHGSVPLVPAAVPLLAVELLVVELPLALVVRLALTSLIWNEMDAGLDEAEVPAPVVVGDHGDWFTLLTDMDCIPRMG